MEEQWKAGRPLSKGGKRVRITTTLEPEGLERLRRYANAHDESVGRTIDFVVAMRIRNESMKRNDVDTK